MSNDAAGFACATDRSVAPPNRAFDAGLRPGPFPDQAASLLPGLLAATRTGLAPAGDNELMSDQVISTNHLQLPGARWVGRFALADARYRVCLEVAVLDAGRIRCCADPRQAGARLGRRHQSELAEQFGLIEVEMSRGQLVAANFVARHPA